jgi:transaldolase
MNKLPGKYIQQIKDFTLEGINLDEGRIESGKDPFWEALKKTGTELWLDTGDMEAAEEHWSAEMTALTTNNTLLNKEIQKGIYDDFIKRADRILEGLELQQRVVEIAFILNARHGLRLVQRFGGSVSVELHTDLAHDLEGIIEYGTRFHEICPDHFIIKVPLTATGIVGARALRDKGIRVNVTLEFSARQNAVVSAATHANYVNVFLGRLNAYISDNDLGDGEMVGEKATISSQRVVSSITGKRKVPSKQIAASLRSGEQLAALAGVDVFTMPTKVAGEGKKVLDATFSSKVGEDYSVDLKPGVSAEEIRIHTLWDVTEKERAFAESLDSKPPASGEEVMSRAKEFGLSDMFPSLSKEEMDTISKDGKIPVHSRWAERIKKGELAIDTLLNLSGLASFTNDQNALDDRIKGLIR